MIALYILLIIAALLGLVLIIPVKIIISANIDEQKIDLKYGFLKLALYPKKTNAEKKDEEKTDKPKNKTSKKAKLTKKQMFGLIPLTKDEFINLLKHLLKYSFRHLIKIRELNIKGTFGTGNPADTGVLCGAVYSGVYTAISGLEQKAGLKSYDVDLTPDFDNAVFNVGMYAEIRTRILHFLALLNIILIHGIKIFNIYSKFKKQMKGNKNDG